jgi:antitoxin HicB
MYAVILEPDDNGTLLVTCPDLPEVTTFGDDAEDAVQRAADAIEEALASRIAHHEDIPAPSAPDRRQTVKLGPRRKIRLSLPPTPPSEPTRRAISLAPLILAKVELYRAVRACGMSKAELWRRLGWHAPQVDRLFDLRHRSNIEHIDQALRTIGKRLVVSVQDAA